MKYNLELIRGDTLAFGFEVEGITELDAAYFSVKANTNETEYILQKTLDDGIAKVEDGKYSVRVAPSDTHDLEADTYYYDLQIEKNGDVFTVLHGKLKVIVDVTREINEAPTSVINITENGEYDVTGYATANVNVETYENEINAAYADIIGEVE